MLKHHLSDDFKTVFLPQIIKAFFHRVKPGRTIKILIRILRLFSKIMAVVLAVLFVLVAMLNIPAIQTLITQQISKKISTDYNLDVRLGGVKIAYPKTVNIRQIFVAGQEGDTLLFVNRLDVSVGLFGLFRNEVNVNSIEIDGLKGKVLRGTPGSAYNFQFIIDAFTSDSTQAMNEEQTAEAKPWKISVDEIRLSSIDGHFRDETLGMDARINLGLLELTFESINLDNLSFFVDEIKLENTSVSYEQWLVEGTNQNNPTAVQQNVEPSDEDFPAFGLNHLLLQNVDFSYFDHGFDLSIISKVGSLVFSPKEIDLAKKILNLGDLEIEYTSAMISMGGDTTAVNTDVAKPAIKNESTTIAETSIFPDWKISLESLKIDQLNFGFDDKTSKPVVYGMDYSHIILEDFGIDLNNLYVNKDRAGVLLRQLKFKEKSGVDLNNLSLEALFTNDSISITGLEIKTGKSHLQGDFNSQFKSFAVLTENPGAAFANINLGKSSLNTTEVFHIAGINPDDAVFSKYNNLDVKFDALIGGKIDSLNVDHFNIAVLDQTRINVKGSLVNATNFNDLNFDLAFDTITTNKNEIIFLTDSSYFADFKLPDNILTTLTAKGTPDSLHAAMNFASNFGNIKADAFYWSGNKFLPDSMNLKLDILDLQLGKVLNDSVIGSLSMNLLASGSGLTGDSISMHAKGMIDSAAYQKYTYRDIGFEGTLKGTDFKTTINSGDPNADFDFVAKALLNSDSTLISSTLNINLINLYLLNFTNEKTAFRGKFEVDGNYAAINKLKAKVAIRGAGIYNGDDYYELKPVFINPVFTPQSTFLDFKSELLGLELNSNIPVDKMGDVLTLAGNKFLGLADTLELPQGKTLDFKMNLNLTPEFTANIFPELKQLSMDTIMGSYSSDNNHLKLNLSAPEIKWDDFVVEDLHLKINGAQDSLTFVSGFQNLYYDTLLIGMLNVNESINHGKIKSRISLSGDPANPDYLFKNNIQVSDKGVSISFADEGLILNGKPWKIHPENYLKIYDSAMYAHEFIFADSAQQFGIETKDLKNTILFSDFDLSNLLNIVNVSDDFKIFKGKLNAMLDLPADNNNAGVKANISIIDFNFLETPVGDLKFDLWENEIDLALNLSLINKENSITAEGNIEKSDYPQKINISTNINIDDPQWFELFSFGEVSETEGKIEGQIEAGGNIESPIIRGFINFKDTRMRINKLNLMAEMRNETINFNNKGISFRDFTTYDSHGGKFILDGNLLTKNYTNFDFDLNIKASDFQPANSTKKDNPEFYGSFIFDADISLKGNTELPLIDADLTVKEGTNLTYVLPGSEIELVSPEGIVNFTDPNQSTDSIFRVRKAQNITDSLVSKFKGIDLNAKLKLDPKAKFTIVIDPYSGDYSSVSGSAVLLYSIDPSGTQTLTGVFEVTEGIYQLSFYGLVKKTFTFQPGSTVAWSGNVMDANMNFTAINVVKTQSVALVSNESAGMTEAEKNMFKQRLPYEVMLNLNGFLSEPVVNFNIDLPEKYLVNYPTIASKLTMLNSGQNESELNKQVFALLVTGNFIADSPFASTGGSAENFATTAARNSVNGILADQLNKMSSRFIKGVDMNFGLTSYEDYSGGGSEVRTELDVQVSKKLLNDRLTIEASGSFDVEGSKQYTGGSTSHTYGEFSATYDLTESREYKLRVYRENAYDLFDGEVSYSGLAFIIEKSFNTLFKRKNIEAGQNEKPEEKNESNPQE